MSYCLGESRDNMDIDKTKTYHIGDFSFINFITLDSETIENIRIWRNHPDIRKVMYSSEEISQDQHTQFISSLSNATDKYYWIVYRNDIPLGVVNIVDVDAEEMVGQFGYYLFPDFTESGLGIEFISMALQFLFEEVGLMKIFGRTEIKNRNALVVNYHLGFRFRPDVAVINGRRYIEQDIVRSEFINKNLHIQDPKSLLKSIRDFNNIYKCYKA